MPRTTALFRACIVLAAVTAARCHPNPCQRDKPCLNWVSLGETYSVELVQQLELDPGDGKPYPISVPNTLRPCGPTLDLATGDTIRIAAEARSDASKDDQCSSGCFYVTIRPSIVDVAFISTDRTGGSVGTPEFLVRANVRIGSSCRGSYEMSVNPVRDYFLRASDKQVATDHILFREFIADVPSACVDRSTQLADGGGSCWDAWAVRVKDSSGKLVTRDLTKLPAPGSDAGAAATADAAGR